MPPDAHSKLSKYLEGLSSPEPAPPQGPKQGDPQLAALAQYLATKKHLNERDIIVDFGSGSGVLGTLIDKMWRDEPRLPRYFAVDRPEPLAALSLPARVHNNSKKINVEDFYGHELASHAGSIALVIIRNVLNELNIGETAQLFAALNEYLLQTSEIYIPPRGA